MSACDGLLLPPPRVTSRRREPSGLVNHPLPCLMNRDIPPVRGSPRMLAALIRGRNGPDSVLHLAPDRLPKCAPPIRKLPRISGAALARPRVAVMYARARPA
jgi:hypothetical protein